MWLFVPNFVCFLMYAAFHWAFWKKMASVSGHLRFPDPIDLFQNGVVSDDTAHVFRDL
jgi:hypothetical protein